MTKVQESDERPSSEVRDASSLPQNQPPLPQPDPSPTSDVCKETKGEFHGLPFVKEVYKRYGIDNAPMIAAAMSFFTLLAFIPMMLIGVSVLGYFLDERAARLQVMQFFLTFLPGLAGASHLQNDLTNTIDGILQGVKQGPKTLAGIGGLLGLVWSSSAVFLNLEIALNNILGAEKNRNFVKSRLVAFTMMFLIGALLIGSIALTWTINFIKGYKLSIAGFEPGQIPFLWNAVFFLIPVILTFAMFLAVYKLIPNAKVHWRAGMIGAAFATVFFELAKHGFGWYVGHFANFDKVYGTLGTIVFLVTWILYSYFIVLVGAEVADVYSDMVLNCPAVDPPAA